VVADGDVLEPIAGGGAGGGEAIRMTTTATSETKINANEFFLGLFAALKLHGQEAFSIRADRFDATIKEIFDKTPELPGGDRVSLTFRVRPHEIYGDSRTVRRALTAAAQRRVISFDNPEYLDIRIQLDEFDAERKLKRLGAPDGYFDGLADAFLRAYRKRRDSATA
jgi:hypothetical protein